MPEDKDFKRLVRARMARTGERYTQARSSLRPEAPPPRPDAGPREARPMPAVVPMDFDALVDLRAQLNRTPREQSAEGSLSSGPGPRWELTVSAGGPLDTIGAEPLSLSAVAALGTSLQGAGFIGMGLDMGLPLPADAPAGNGRRPPPGMLTEAQDQLFDLVQRETGFVFPRGADNKVITSHRSQTSRLEDGSGHVAALTNTCVMIRPHEEWAVDLGAVRTRASPLPGRPWASYGVIVVVNRAFPQRHPPEGDGYYSRPFPDIDREFWHQSGEALSAGAAAAQLPAWPLHEGWMRCLSTFVRIGRHYQPYWGHFRGGQP